MKSHPCGCHGALCKSDLRERWPRLPGEGRAGSMPHTRCRQRIAARAVQMPSGGSSWERRAGGKLWGKVCRMCLCLGTESGLSALFSHHWTFSTSCPGVPNSPVRVCLQDASRGAWCPPEQPMACSHSSRSHSLRWSHARPFQCAGFSCYSAPNVAPLVLPGAHLFFSKS